MSMNLRENKIDKFDSEKKFFSGFNKKNIDENKNEQSMNPIKTQATQQLQATQPKTQNVRNEKWIRKAPKNPLSEEKLDYQEVNDFEKEYSQYLRENPEDVLVSWRGPDFEHYPHDKKWYMSVLIILALIIFYAVWTNSIIMAIVFGLIGLVGYLQLSRPPKIIDFAVTYDGILVGNEIFDFDEIKSFWIFYEPPHTRIISLHVKSGLRPYLHIPLHQVDPVIVHEKLVEFIPEERQEQNIVDILERLLHM